ncbi:MAG: transaldolase family protein [Bacillales bacterium]|nr:transaldolase family protein [Bacillales bacterium]
MKYYLDSAKLNEIDYAYKFYKIDGVTTNPNHIRNSGKPFLVAITGIANWIKENNLEGKDELGNELFPVSVEINPHLDNYQDMIVEARKIHEISPNFVIKIPCNLEGVKAAKLLEEEGIRTNVTLVFSPSQAIQVGRINARYVSPFIGWKEASGDDGIEYLKQIVKIYKEKGYKTEIICAAVRSGKQIAECAAMGADIITAGLAVYEDALLHPFTDFGLKKFQDAWDHTEGN